ncbi:MAG: signal recognition particle protein [Thermoprotei archaeon]|nr:MAG: signal recognition particle protein [Thermoprotei archaeon]
MESLRKGLLRVVSRIRRETILDRKSVKRILRELQRELLKADVSPELVLELTTRVERRVFKESLPPGFSRRDLLLRVLYEELVNMLGGEEKYELRIRRRGYVMLLVGLQGSGKTTTAAKLAYYFGKRGYRVGLVCADNYRPGALDQLKQLSRIVGAEFYGREGAQSSATLAREGVSVMRSKGVDVIIVDTAGRHKEERGLLEEMKEIAETVKPDEVVLVLDATMGKRAGSHAEAFHKVVPVGSIIITKMDGAARGGGALAAVARTGARISFIGVGEKVEELEPFDPPSFVSRLLGMGDLKALVERMRKVELRAKPETFLTGRFTLLEFKNQLEEVTKLGPLRKLLELMPGAPQLTPELEEAGRQNIKRWLAIMNSMTVEELTHPETINRSRMLRIARGSGTTVKDVRELLAAYRRTRKLLKSLARRRRALSGVGINV